MPLEHRALNLQTAPVAEPLILADAKLHLRIDTGDDDDLVDSLVSAAREWCEEFTRRAFITQTWDAYYEGFPAGGDIWIPKPPLQSVGTFEFTDSDGTMSAVTASTYDVDTDSEPGRIVLKHSEQWPTDTLAESNPVHVRFTAGYGAEPSDVPSPIRVAMKLLIGHWYCNRESVVVGSTTTMLDMSVKALLGPYRVKGMN